VEILGRLRPGGSLGEDAGSEKVDTLGGLVAREVSKCPGVPKSGVSGIGRLARVEACLGWNGIIETVLSRMDEGCNRFVIQAILTIFVVGERQGGGKR